MAAVASSESMPGMNDETPKADQDMSGFYTRYFKRYELLIEFKNLQHPSQCPPGIYIMPSPDNLNEWYGCLFIHKGFYARGVFKFVVKIPESYPQLAPSVTFLTDMFHPLIDRFGNMDISHHFPTWRPRKDLISHVLKYVKECFKESILSKLDENSVPNKDSLHMFVHERPLFAKLAAQCATLSVSDSILYDSYLPNNPVKFAPIQESQIQAILKQLEENNS
ncbi:hypothetical protein SmJEL517_g04910 [Synchytrium microbalum]|uniref:UBC core domain-containing protein n=1 Tax=Synchytrium microbalum TaxID=1806994 RepID=A0A507C2W4_9FUNG|nr:uncharacterized protein SmJEL517_g04910 [Synchytrium microbalum]TPX31853.1 hypothetical protein SmJEL517_g04910 [Synchytrium microbalum]